MAQKRAISRSAPWGVLGVLSTLALGACSSHGVVLPRTDAAAEVGEAGRADDGAAEAASASDGSGNDGGDGEESPDANDAAGTSDGDAPEATGDADAVETSDGALAETGDAATDGPSNHPVLAWTGDELDTRPWRALNVTARTAQLVHNVMGHTMGVDTRAPTLMGRLVVDLGVTGGGYQVYLGKRGFHAMGVSMPDCVALDVTAGRDTVGNCRLNALDGLPHGDQSSVTPLTSVIGQVTTMLLQARQQFPDEDWGYFLNQDNTVRWSDVSFTGFDHGASNPPCFAHKLRLYRVVTATGPRDNLCGKSLPSTGFDPTNPPYDVACPLERIASWLDTPSATPIDRYYGFTGTLDVQFGDILFAMNRLQYLGVPVNVSTTPPPYGGSHRLYAPVAHVDLFQPNPTLAFPTNAIDDAFGVPPENRDPKF